jgi:hypothetical protein
MSRCKPTFIFLMSSARIEGYKSFSHTMYSGIGQALDDEGMRMHSVEPNIP